MKYEFGTIIERREMMILYDKLNSNPETIYAVLDDSNGYPKFLIRKGNQWIWRSAKHYITEEVYQARMKYFEEL